MLLVGGAFTTLGGQGRNRIARLNTDGSLDSSFNPNANYTAYAVAVQGDGKILVGGDFTTLGGRTRNRFARLNADGSLDIDFDPNANGPFRSPVLSLVLQADGKIIAGGFFTTLHGRAISYLARLNMDGTLDTSFNPDPSSQVTSVAVQADGNILVTGFFSRLAGRTCYSLGRLNNTTLATSILSYGADQITWMRGGSAPELGRTSFEYTTNGSSWVNLGAGTRIPGGWEVRGVSMPLGTLRACGYTVGGEYNGSAGFVETSIGAPGITSQPPDRTNNAGTTATFQVGVVGTGPMNYQWRKGGTNLPDGGNIAGSSTATLSVGNVLRDDASGYDVVISNSHGSVTSRLAHLSVQEPAITAQPFSQVGDVGRDVSFSVTAASTGPLRYQWRKNGVPIPWGLSADLSLTNIQPESVGNYDVVVCAASLCVTSLVGTLYVNQAVLDPTFDARAAGYVVYSVALQTDGKILVGGGFTSLCGQKRNSLARFNPDGSLDWSFNPGVRGEVYALVVQSDGKILVGGSFASLGDQPRRSLGRLNADGTVDIGFDAPANQLVGSLALQPDGKVLVGGSFSTLCGQPRGRIARLNADGTLDPGFNPNADNRVTSLAVQTDGKIVVGGLFQSLAGQRRNYLGRLNADGTLDDSFNPNASSWVESLVVQPDAKILVGGDFTLVGGKVRVRIARLNADGSIDQGFNPNADNLVYAVTLQADGHILVGGRFTTLGGLPRNRIGRINADGALDTDFNPAADGAVRALTLQTGGSILIGGEFTALNGQPRNRLGHLYNTHPATTTLSSAGTNILWVRGGTAPEVWRTDFEYSSNGTVWVGLGSGSRVAGGWTVSGVPWTNGTLRARGYSAGGFYCASGGIVETGIGSPGITTQPAGCTNSAETMANFSVGSVGTAPLGFQWFALKASQTCASAVALTFSGFVYDAVIINSGSGYSRTPVARIVGGGGFGAEAEAVVSNGVVSAINILEAGFGYTSVPAVVIDPPDGFLPGATNALLSLAGLSPDDAGNYFVVITNNYGSVTSTPALLNVRLQPIIVAQPTNQVPKYGLPTRFAVTADGGIPLNYQWFRNGDLVNGATNPALAIASATESFAGAYSVVVTNSYGTATSSVARLTVQLPPLILAQPESQWPLYAAPATFKVAVDGATPQRFQWLRDGSGVGGATNQSLAISSATDTEAGNYAVIIANEYGSATSEVATLTVRLAPEILAQPTANTTVLKGSSTALGVTANGATPLSYQWTRNGGIIAGATNASLALPSVTTNDSGSYTVRVVNRYGSATSSVAQVVVVFKPEILLQPVGTVVKQGSNVQFSVQVAGTTPLSYVWIKDGFSCPNATIATMTITNVQPARIGAYQAIISNAYGSVTSSVASLSIANVNSNAWEGIMAYYPLDGNAQDDSGHGKDGVPYAVESATNRWGLANSALRFNGTNSYIWIGTNVRSSPLTASAWFQTVATTNALGGGGNVILRDRFNGWNLLVRMPSGRVSAEARPSGAGPVESGEGLNDGSWHMGTLTYDGYTTAVYVDGTLAQRQTESPYLDIDYQPGGLAIGRDGDAAVLYFQGSIDDVALYNRALSANDIAQLYASVAVPPAIARQPQSVNVFPGTNVAFAALTTGSNPLRYQWRRNGQNLANATNSSLSISNVAVADVGDYTLVAWNPAGSATSSVAALVLEGPPYILQEPQGQVVILGSSAALAVGAGGSVPLRHQWYWQPGVLLQAQAKPTVLNKFVVGATVTDGGAGYTSVPNVVITGGGGNGVTATATVSNGVVVRVNIVTAGSGYTNPPLVQIAVPSGAVGMLFQQTNEVLNVAPATRYCGGDYYAVVTNVYGRATSSLARLELALPPLTATRNSAVSLQLDFPSAPLATAVLQYATNLAPPVVWRSQFTNTADTNGVWRYVETNFHAPQRFYRVTIP